MSLLSSLTARLRLGSGSDDRLKAVRRERDYAERAPWLGPVLERHRHLSAAFAAVSKAKSGKARQAALKQLHAMLSAHSRLDVDGSGADGSGADGSGSTDKTTRAGRIVT